MGTIVIEGRVRREHGCAPNAAPGGYFRAVGACVPASDELVVRMKAHGEGARFEVANASADPTLKRFVEAREESPGTLVAAMRAATGDVIAIRERLPDGRVLSAMQTVRLGHEGLNERPRFFHENSTLTWNKDRTRLAIDVKRAVEPGATLLVSWDGGVQSITPNAGNHRLSLAITPDTLLSFTVIDVTGLAETTQLRPRAR